MIPKKLIILGREFCIKKAPLKKATGECQPDHHVITIDPEYPFDRQESSLFHEILEDLDNELDIGLTHHQLILISAGMYSVLKSNGMLK